MRGMNLCILRMLEDTFTLGSAHIVFLQGGIIFILSGNNMNFIGATFFCAFKLSFASYVG